MCCVLIFLCLYCTTVDYDFIMFGIVWKGAKNETVCKVDFACKEFYVDTGINTYKYIIMHVNIYIEHIW